MCNIYDFLQFRRHATLLAIFVAGHFLVLGIKLSIQPSFYPKEADARGATPSQERIKSFCYLLYANGF